ncbi:hypothetical protein XELAEV_18041766mg [Xenopus laevis]|uniref:Peptidase A2 domain-containing protein n=1 Tax=Xenopus laevis TaxID=8355 RepID=A0A974C2V0_XENLA|nr:hypothetical protein XELAEV_18041766mg [Xenopus laevis]
MSVASCESGNTPEQMIHNVVQFIYTRLKFDQGMDSWINDLKKNARADLNDIWATDGLVERYLTCMNLASSSSDEEKKLICALPPVLYALMEVDTLSKARKEDIEKLRSQLHEIESNIQHMKSERNQLEIDISNKEAFIRDLETDAEHSRIAYRKLREDFEELRQQLFKNQQSGVYGVERSPDPPVITSQYKNWAPYVPRAKPIDNVDSEAQGVLGRLAEACQAVTTLLGNHRTRTPIDSCQDSSPERNERRKSLVSNVSYKSYASNLNTSGSESDERKRDSSPVPRRGKNTHKRGSKGKNPQYPATHLEMYESTMDSLDLSEADRISFLPWAFDDRYRHYFSSFRERGITRWQSVLHEIKLEFGPYRNTTAAKREIYRLTCRPNQSPRDFLSVLKNAYGLAYRDPDWESIDFKQLFYEALPTQIKLSLAHDMDIESPLEKLVTSATLLFNISEGQNLNERKFEKFPEHNVDESRVKPHLNFESQPKKVPSANGSNQQNRRQPNPIQNKPQNPKGSDGNSSGSGSQDYRPRFNRDYRGYQGRQNYRGYQEYRHPQGYRRWDNRPRQQWVKGQESPNSPRGKSPTGNQNGPQNQNPRKPSRFDQLADQVSKLTDIPNKVNSRDPMSLQPVCEIPSVQFVPVVESMGTQMTCRRNQEEINPNILTLQKDHSLTQQMANHSNFLCNLLQLDGRYFIDTCLQGLLDTRSQVTILSFSHFQQILGSSKKKPRLAAFDGSLISVGGDSLQVKGTSWLTYKIGKKILRHPTLIVDLPYDRLIIGIDLLKRLNSIIDFINEAIWTQVKIPIAFERSHNTQSQPSCHMIEERPNSVEIHFRNSQIPNISILKNGKPEESVNTSFHIINIQKDKIEKIILEDDVLTISLKGGNQEVAGITRHAQSLVKIEKTNDTMLVPVQVNNIARVKYAKLDLKSEASYISLGLLAQITNPQVITFSSSQKWVYDLDKDDQSQNVIARCILSWWSRALQSIHSAKMPSQMIAILYAVLILGKELHAERIVMPGPSSGIMLQDTAGFIMTNKRILSQKVYMSLDPRCIIERQVNVSNIRSPEIQT